MSIGARPRSLRIGERDVRISRTAGGVVRLQGQDDRDLAAGLGYAHAHDRMTQMMLVRLIAQGRISECLKNDAATLAIDVFMRQMGFAADALKEAEALPPEARALGEAYCAGVNAYLSRHARPLELLLVGYRPEPWTLADIAITILVMSYAGLAQTQQDVEKLLVQAIQAGVDVAKLKKLFRPHLDAVDEALVSLVRQVRIHDGLVPREVAFLSGMPRLVASNNWAVAAGRSASGAALQANDPHLEVNRLPAIWYEVVGETSDDYRMGITMPGIPGLVMGRTRRVSFGFTYGFMDTIDYFIEECRDGRYRRGDAFREFSRRVEVIRRKGATPVEVAFLEDEHGVLESDPRAERLEDGYYLCRAWSGRRGGAAGALAALGAVLSARNVDEACVAARRVTIPCNWVLADRDGRIAYQQSGLLPARKHSGLHPVPGWREELDWKGTVDPADLASIIDPPEGFIATANDDRNREGGPIAVNVSMGPDRVDRIRELLSAKPALDVEDMKRIQCDLFSPQAERFMAALRPLLPDTPEGRLLGEWDRRYDRHSKGATLFEAVYSALLREVFGRRLFGVEAWDVLAAETYVVADYFHVFDDALLGDDPAWCGDEGREALFRRVAHETLARFRAGGVRAWGELRTIVMRNVFFDGRLPRFLGFDYGPVALEGGRATVMQGSLLRAHGRTTTFAPSWRYVTDMGLDSAETALPGGPSGRRFSKHYLTDVEGWLRRQYKRLDAKR